MSVHIIGNGSVCAVYDGASILQAFGPTYSSPNAFRMDAGDGWTTVRVCPGVFRSERGCVTVTDWVVSGTETILCRRIAGKTAMRLTADQPLFPVPETVVPDAFMSECHAGQVVYPYEFENGVPHGYVSARKRYFGLRLYGELTLEPDGDSFLLSGEGTVLFAFADEAGALFCLLSDPDILGRNAEPKLLADSFRQDEIFFGLTLAQKEYLAPMIGVYDTITAQQCVCGGVLAGYNFHLCYLRDNYGVYRGLRAMGANDEADRLARYYVHIYRTYGDIHNAQGPDEYAFHVHENDSTEITAYLFLMLADAMQSGGSGLRGYEADAYAVMEEMLNRQHSQLTDGMLPFNGDETYIAGGILSRACMNDGSMEATALYHKCLCEAEALAAREPAFRLPDYTAADRAEIERTFRDHFFVDGRWVCNCPGLPAPAYRHGVRACGHGFGLSFCNGNGDYVCPACLGKNLPPIWQGGGERYAVPAAILCPAFVDSPLIPVSERTEAALAVLDACESTGRGTGYDLGFVLWALTEKEALAEPGVRERALAVREKLLTMTDEFGAYSEYYTDGFTKQAGTLCRPWESGINIAAILRSADVL